MAENGGLVCPAHSRARGRFRHPGGSALPRRRWAAGAGRPLAARRHPACSARWAQSSDRPVPSFGVGLFRCAPCPLLGEHGEMGIRKRARGRRVPGARSLRCLHRRCPLQLSSPTADGTVPWILHRAPRFQAPPMTPLKRPCGELPGAGHISPMGALILVLAGLKPPPPARLASLQRGTHDHADRQRHGTSARPG